MRCEASLCGLALRVAVEGEEEACATLAAALAPHAVSRSGFEQELAALLELELRLFPGFPPSFDRLVVERVDDAFSVQGVGVSGVIGGERGRLDVVGGGLVALQTAIRLACALWLAPRSGLLLHGASVEQGGRTAAFLGPSGAGKSTLARRLRAAGVRVIADEVAAVRFQRNDQRAPGARLFGHPLPRRVGDGLAPEEGFPLAAIGLISHASPGEAPRVVQLDRARAARALLRRIFLPAAHSSLVEHAMATVEVLAESVPVWALSLPDDDRATAAALELLRPAGVFQ